MSIAFLLTSLIVVASPGTGVLYTLAVALTRGSRASIAAAFGCTLEGAIPDAQIARLAERLMAAGCDEVGISDTTGYADPAAVRRLIALVRDAVGEGAVTGIHLHNTRGLGLANALAALECGLTTLDSSLGGLGGCPFAPGATGNVATEDAVWTFEKMGISTGIDLDRLLDIAEDGVEIPGALSGGRVRNAMRSKRCVTELA